MMSHSLGLLHILYLFVLAGTIVAPFVNAQPARSIRSDAGLVAFTVALLLVALSILMLRGPVGLTTPLVLSTGLIIPLVKRGSISVMIGLATLSLFATAAWWLPPGVILEVERTSAFLALVLGVASLLYFQTDKVGLPTRTTIAALTLAGLMGASLTGQFSAPDVFIMLWHHWGAYIMPAQNVLDGGVPFRDFPVQYGIGPTLMIAAACGQDCWPGTYAVIAVANILYLGVMGACVWSLTAQLNRNLACLAILSIMFANCLWIGFPLNFTGPLLTPSVGGLRFLPLATLLLHIIWSETHSIENDRRGHALWFLGVAWSPEACFHVSAVWWPYRALRQLHGLSTQSQASWQSAGSILVSHALQAIVALGTALLILAIVFRLGFQTWPSLEGYLTYITSPPGVMTANTQGPIWLLVFAILASAVSLSWMNPARQRLIVACALALIATASYYLGRSHDNNVINVFPFFALCLISCMTSTTPKPVAAFVHIALAGIVCWVPTFKSPSWETASGKNTSIQFGPARLLERISLTHPDSHTIADQAVRKSTAKTSDLAAALAWIKSAHVGQPVIASEAALLARARSGPIWTGMNNLANYDLLPEPVIAKYITQGAMTFQRSGWLIVDTKLPGKSLDRFNTSYTIADEKNFGDYKAYLMMPR